MERILQVTRTASSHGRNPHTNPCPKLLCHLNSARIPSKIFRPIEPFARTNRNSLSCCYPKMKFPSGVWVDGVVQSSPSIQGLLFNSSEASFSMNQTIWDPHAQRRGRLGLGPTRICTICSRARAATGLGPPSRMGLIASGIWIDDPKEMMNKFL